MERPLDDPRTSNVHWVYKFFSNNCPDYFDEIYFPVETRGVQTRSAHQQLKGALKVPHRKTNIGQKASYHIGPSL